MTRLLAFADTQIGAPTVELADQAAVLEQIMQLALDNDVQAVLHGGDVFEGPIVTPEQLRVFIDGISPLRRNGIPLLVIRGNGRHDMATRPVHALDVLREIDGIVVHDRPGLWSPIGLVVCTLPWVHPGMLLARVTAGELLRNTTVDHDTVNTAMATLLVRIAADQLEYIDEQRPSPYPRVLLAHWAISGSKLPTGLSTDELREPVLPWHELDALGYDVIIGAHIHEPQRLGHPDADQTVGIVVGSPQQLNHGEKGDHGCWLIDIPGPAGEDVRTEFVPLESRPFLTLDVTLGAGDDNVEIRGGPADPGSLDGAIVRIRVTADEEQARRVDLHQLRRGALAAGAHKVTVETKIEKKTRARVEQMTEELGPVEALVAYCDAQEIGDPLRARMVERLEEWMAA